MPFYIIPFLNEFYNILTTEFKNIYAKNKPLLKNTALYQQSSNLRSNKKTNTMFFGHWERISNAIQN
jgi:hypothetical protein